MAHLLVFARLRELAGARHLEVPGTTAAEVVDGACARYGPEFAAVAARSSIVVDDELVPRGALDGIAVGDGTEVALLPPVSGGALDVPPAADEAVVVAGLSAEPIDVAALRAAVARPDCGGIVTFEGTTRSPNHGVAVVGLDYEAWERRAEAQIDAIAREAVARHGLRGVAAVHRVGLVGVGEVAVAVVAVAPHRDGAFAGAREVIDRVKAEAAVWKRELRQDGGEWLEGC
jgi:molybdopterin synthase catalytic subunit/molybdopterin converting factor small subunit